MTRMMSDSMMIPPMPIMMKLVPHRRPRRSRRGLAAAAGSAPQRARTGPRHPDRRRATKHAPRLRPGSLHRQRRGRVCAPRPRAQSRRQTAKTMAPRAPRPGPCPFYPRAPFDRCHRSGRFPGPLRSCSQHSAPRQIRVRAHCSRRRRRRRRRQNQHSFAPLLRQAQPVPPPGSARRQCRAGSSVRAPRRGGDQSQSRGAARPRPASMVHRDPQSAARARRPEPGAAAPRQSDR
jgi:hypothetical protein